METNPITIRVQIDGKEETFKLDAKNPVSAGLKQDTVRKEARSIFQSDIMKNYDSTDYSSRESVYYGKKNGILDAKEQSVFLNEVAKAAGEDKVLSSEEFDKFVSDKFYDGQPLTEAQQRNHRYFLRDISDKQIKENPQLGTPQSAPQVQPAKAETPQAPVAPAPEKPKTLPPAKAPATPAQPAKAESPQAQQASGETQIVEPKNKEVTVDRWGAKVEKGKLANDCLERIIKNNYPEIKPYSKEYNALMKEIATKNPEAFGKTKDGKPDFNVMKTGTKIELPTIDKKTGKITEAPAKPEPATEAEPEKIEPTKTDVREESLSELDETLKKDTLIDERRKQDLEELKPYLRAENADRLTKWLNDPNYKKEDIATDTDRVLREARELKRQAKEDLGFWTDADWTKTPTELDAREDLRKAIVEEGLKPGSLEYQTRLNAAKEKIEAEQEVINQYYYLPQ